MHTLLHLRLVAAVHRFSSNCDWLYAECRVFAAEFARNIKYIQSAVANEIGCYAIVCKSLTTVANARAVTFNTGCRYSSNCD